MNRRIAMIGTVIVETTVFLFALCLLLRFSFGSYLVCLILPIGYIMMTVGFYHERRAENSSAALIGLVLGTIYAVITLLVYFSQLTAVNNDGLSGEALRVLDFGNGGLMFSYDLLAYGMMSLSTFFIGLTVKRKTRTDSALKLMMLIHGFFFFPCLILPMTGMFSGMAEGSMDLVGTVSLLVWCVYFMAIGILTFNHFNR